MKKIITILILSLITFSTTFGINTNINIEGNNNLGKFYIGKVEENTFKEFGVKDIKKDNGDLNFSIFGEGFYIKNNYLLGDNFELKGKIKEKVLQKVGFRNHFDMKKGDVVLFEQKFITTKKGINYIENNLGKNIVVSQAVDDDLIFQKTFKIKCYKDNFYTYDSLVFPFLGWYDEENISDNYHDKIGLKKDNIQIKLKKTFKNCQNFNKMFDVESNKELNYKYKEGYVLKKEKLKLSLNKKFGKIFSKISGDKLTKLLDKIEKLREEKNNDKTLNQDKKDNINILLDALIEILN